MTRNTRSTRQLSDVAPQAVLPIGAPSFMPAPLPLAASVAEAAPLVQPAMLDAANAQRDGADAPVAGPLVPPSSSAVSSSAAALQHQAALKRQWQAASGMTLDDTFAYALHSRAIISQEAFVTNNIDAVGKSGLMKSRLVKWLTTFGLPPPSAQQLALLAAAQSDSGGARLGSAAADHASRRGSSSSDSSSVQSLPMPHDANDAQPSQPGSASARVGRTSAGGTQPSVQPPPSQPAPRSAVQSSVPSARRPSAASNDSGAIRALRAALSKQTAAAKAAQEQHAQQYAELLNEVRAMTQANSASTAAALATAPQAVAAPVAPSAAPLPTSAPTAPLFTAAVSSVQSHYMPGLTFVASSIADLQNGKALFLHKCMHVTDTQGTAVRRYQAAAPANDDAVEEQRITLAGAVDGTSIVLQRPSSRAVQQLKAVESPFDLLEAVSLYAYLARLHVPAHSDWHDSLVLLVIEKLVLADGMTPQSLVQPVRELVDWLIGHRAERTAAGFDSLALTDPSVVSKWIEIRSSAFLRQQSSMSVNVAVHRAYPADNHMASPHSAPPQRNVRRRLDDGRAMPSGTRQPVCRNYNGKGCTRPCGYRHVCLSCDSDAHTQATCPRRGDTGAAAPTRL